MALVWLDRIVYYRFSNPADWPGDPIKIKELGFPVRSWIVPARPKVFPTNSYKDKLLSYKNTSPSFRIASRSALEDYMRSLIHVKFFKKSTEIIARTFRQLFNQPIILHQFFIIRPNDFTKFIHHRTAPDCPGLPRTGCTWPNLIEVINAQEMQASD